MPKEAAELLFNLLAQVRKYEYNQMPVYDQLKLKLEKLQIPISKPKMSPKKARIACTGDESPPLKKSSRTSLGDLPVSRRTRSCAIIDTDCSRKWNAGDEDVIDEKREEVEDNGNDEPMDIDTDDDINKPVLLTTKTATNRNRGIKLFNKTTKDMIVLQEGSSSSTEIFDG